MSYLEIYVSRLNILSQDTNKRLRQIRELDRKASTLEKDIEVKQKQFIQKVAQTKNKKDLKQRDTLEELYKHIVQMHKECYNISQEKVRLADELYNLVHEPTERLENDLKKMKTDFKEELNTRDPKTRKGKNSKKKIKRGTQQQPLPVNQPRYCYCGKPSYGEMVECQNSLCENQWFHIGCILEKELPQKWFCLNCRKSKDAKRTLRNR